MDGRTKELVASAERDANGVTASIMLDDEEHRVRFAASEDVGREVDFLLPASIPLAMRTGARLKLPGEVSPRLLSALPKIQDWFRLWDDDEFRCVPVDAGARNADAGRASGVGCFFSGGVDSFYTLLKHRDEVTHLIFVHGFDILLADQSLRAQASRMAHKVASELGKALIEVETDIRSFSKGLLGWDKYHGAALASVALLFQHRFCKVLIAATHTYADLIPWGSHPTLDPLWGTELTDFEHDGCEATRPEKVAYISKHEIAMEWLRVCLENANGAYNCGRCGKCLGAMIDLHTAGALERCKTLPSTIDLEAVANLDLSSDTFMPFARQRLKVLERLGTEPKLTQALAEALDKSSETSRARAERAERELKQAHAKLAELRWRNQKLAQRYSQLAAGYSGRRYRLADAIVDSVLRIPGVRRLVRRRVSPLSD